MLADYLETRLENAFAFKPKKQSPFVSVVGMKWQKGETTMYAITKHRQHKLRQCFLSEEDKKWDKHRTVAYLHGSGGAAPEGVDFFEVLWWVDNFSSPATPEQVKEFLARPGVVRLLEDKEAEAPFKKSA